MSNWNDDQNGNQNGGWGAPPPPPTPPTPPSGEQPPAEPPTWGPPPQGQAAYGQQPPPPPQPPVAFGQQYGQQPPPPPPGGKKIFALGPMTFADILDNTFSLMRHNWKALGAAVLVYAVPVGVAGAITNAATGRGGFGVNGGAFSALSGFSGSSNSMSGAEVGIWLVGVLLTVALTYVLLPYVNGAITRLVAAQYLGREMSTKQAFDGVKHLWPRFVGASILVSLCEGAGLIAFIVGAIAIAVLFTSVIPIIAIEEEGVFNSMGRSWALMKRRFWGYTGIRIVMAIAAGFVAFVAQAPALGIAAIFSAIGLDPLAWFFYGLSTVCSSLISMPIAAITATLIYFDSRVRFEGFDVQMMAARMPQNPPTPQ